jgi:uncharacterized protein (TIGR01319 family)
MRNYLLVDFGSTYTKLTAVDIDQEIIIGTAKSMTTIESNVIDGYNQALVNLESITGQIEYDGIMACSSAAGGLKMAAIGLTEELTVKAAKEACLGAGAKVELVFSHHLSKRDIIQIKEKNIDIILLAGGTNGGNQENILYNANRLFEAKLGIPIVLAGNRDVVDEVDELFKDAKADLKVCDNVMPKVNELNVESAKKAIREVFIERIIEAKGIKKMEESTGKVIMPTPEAVLHACELLSKGTRKQPGYGEVILVDIGGATTDVHSIGKGLPKRGDVMFKGLEEPDAKRTVEGDLGMRYSILNLVEHASEEKVQSYMKNKEVNVLNEAKKRRENVDFIPKTDDDIDFDSAIAKSATDLSMSRHVGTIHSYFTPIGNMYYQTGKDLTEVEYVIGTGGVLVHADNDEAVAILKQAVYSREKPLELRPKKAKFLIDSNYILSAMGLLADPFPEETFRMLKKYIVEA